MNYLVVKILRLQARILEAHADREVSTAGNTILSNDLLPKKPLQLLIAAGLMRRAADALDNLDANG